MFLLEVDMQEQRKQHVLRGSMICHQAQKLAKPFYENMTGFTDEAVEAYKHIKNCSQMECMRVRGYTPPNELVASGTLAGLIEESIKNGSGLHAALDTHMKLLKRTLSSSGQAIDDDTAKEEIINATNKMSELLLKFYHQRS